jgi:hypothetical protein
VQSTFAPPVQSTFAPPSQSTFAPPVQSTLSSVFKTPFTQSKTMFNNPFYSSK